MNTFMRKTIKKHQLLSCVTGLLLAAVLLATGCADLQIVGRKAAPKPEGPLQELIANLPAQSAAENEAFCKKTLALGPGAVKDLCGMLVESGSPDLQARLAIHGLTFYVKAPGRESDRVPFCKALAKAMKREKRTVVKSFLIEQLQIAGGEEVVGPLASQLDDPAQCEFATHALLTIGGDGAKTAFRNALPSAEGACERTIIYALGHVKDTGSTGALMKRAKSDDMEIRLAALYALSQIGDPGADKVLRDASESLEGNDRPLVTQYYLDYAGRLAEGGETDKALEIVTRLYKTRTDPLEANVRCASLKILSEIQGVKALYDLLTAMTDENHQVRAQARTLALSYQGDQVTERLLKFYEKCSPEIRAEILLFFADLRDAKMLPTVYAALKDEEATVRKAAIQSAAALGGADAVKPLIAMLAAEDKEELDATKAALTKIQGAQVTADVAEALTNADPSIRAGAVEVLASRKASDYLEQIITASADKEESVRVASLKSLGTLGTDDTVAGLVDALISSQSESERKEAEKTISSILDRSKDKEAAGEPVLKALSRKMDAEPRCALLSLLKKVGTEKAAALAQKAMKDKDSDVADAAVRSLCDWPNAIPMETLGTLAKSSSSQVHRVLALRAYVRLIALPCDRTSSESVELYRKAMSLADREEDRKMVLGEMANTKTAENLSEVAKYLDDAALVEEAMVAAAKICRAIGLSSPAQVKEVIARINELSPEGSVAKDIRRIEKQIEEYEDYITLWELSGPYAEKDIEGPKDVFDIVFLPEKKDAEGVEWKKVSTDAPDNPWLLDFNKICKESNCVAYVRTKVYSPKKQKARLELGSDDGAKAWLNGELVHEENVARGFIPADDKIEITLREGWNDLMIKVSQGGGDWSVGARVRTEEGEHLAELKYME